MSPSVGKNEGIPGNMRTTTETTQRDGTCNGIYANPDVAGSLE